MKVGLFGGTFDPIHMGHLIVAESARVGFQLDDILFIPSAKAPHKQGEVFASIRERKKLLKLALKTNPNFQLCDVELQRGGVSYTVETIKWFLDSKRWSNHILYLLIGADSILELDTWKNPDEILKSMQTLVMTRPGAEIEKADKKYLQKIKHVQVPLIDISSTQIRHRIRAGKSIRYHVPRSVEKYIYRKGLYR
jgi:nicotinate-nucleotide adenylyltransferase